jgi:hypothetical protein
LADRAHYQHVSRADLTELRGVDFPIICISVTVGIECKDVIRMVATKTQPNPVRLLAIGLLLAVLPACQSPGWHPFGWRSAPPGSSNVVLRPAYPWPETKPLYLSGYAGTDYSEMIPRRAVGTGVAPATATSAGAVSIEHGAWDGQ